ncbi:MAG: DUF5717 family protein [Eubacteriales bacterium]|nr:DUF5717 family protein [Eubacteriales bacterium]
MRDFYTKENMQGAAFHVPDAGLSFEPEKLVFETETDTGREGVIRVRHRTGKPARGYVYPSETCMHGVREQFAPAADGTGFIRWRFDARGIAPGRTVRGCFRVVSPYGEYSIPYTVEISGKGELVRKKNALRAAELSDLPSSEEEGQEKISSKEAFCALSQEDFERAAEFFYSSHMEEILTSEEDRTLYRGLSMQEGNLQNVEEFLISACGRDKTLFEPVEKEILLQTRTGAGRAEGRMAGSRAERALEAHRQRVRTNGLGGEPVRREKSREEDLLYATLRIRQSGPCPLTPAVRAEAGFLPETLEAVRDPGQEGEWTVRIPVHRAALHAGRNFGRVMILGPFNEAEVSVEVYCRGGTAEVRRRQEKELDQLQLQLMRLYVDCRLEETHPEGWFQQADRLIDEISMRSHRDLIPRLYGVHLFILRGQNAEAQRELGRIALRYAGTDAAQNFSARFPGEQEEAYCYRQYLYARCREEDAQLRARVVRFLRGVYRQTGSWRTAWMLLDLSEEYAPGTGARWNFLRHQFESGCNSPVIWCEAWEMVRQDPQILLPGSSVQERWARDDFGLHVLWYAARNRVLTEKAAQVMVSLAEKKKTFSGLLYRGLCAAYAMYDESGSVTEAGAPENGGDPERAEDPERQGDREKTAGVFGEGADNGSDRIREELLRAICILLVRGQDLSARAHRWYAKAVDAQISLTRLEESWQQSMPADDAEYRLPAGRNAILRTTAHRPVRAVLVYDRFRAEQTVPVRDGIAFLSVYGDANTVFLEDAVGNRYAKSLPYALDVQQEDPQDIRRESSAPRPADAASRRRNMKTSGQEAEDPYRLAAKIGFGDRGRILLRQETAGADGLQEDAAAAAGRLLDSGLLTAQARTQLLFCCLDTYRGHPDLQQFLLAKADPAQCSAPERAQLYTYLADAGAFPQALRWLLSYGAEEAGAQLLSRICMGLPWEGGALPALISTAWEAFRRGNMEQGLLEKLSETFSGLSRELLDLRKACADQALSTRELDQRIIRQVLYSGATEQGHARILVSAGPKLGEAFLPAVAQYCDYAFSGGISMGDRMTELVAGLIAEETAGSAASSPAEEKGEIEDICRIACLKELSMRQGEISLRERSAARASLSALLSRGIIFPFYRQFPGYDDRLDLYAEETLVQYHPAGPDDGKGRKIVFHYSTSRRGEAGNYRSRPMKEMYRDFYVSGFLLFYGEQMRYYITDDAAEKHVVQSGTIGQDARILEACSGRFGLINETTRAAALRDYDEALSLLTGYYRRSYLENELFRR